MPPQLRKLALVYLFQWYAHGRATGSSSRCPSPQSVFGTTDPDSPEYSEAVAWTGLVNGWYNIVTFLRGLPAGRLRHASGAPRWCTAPACCSPRSG